MRNLIMALVICLVSAEALASNHSRTLGYNVSWGNVLLAKGQLKYEFFERNVKITANAGSGWLVAPFRTFKSYASAELAKKDSGWVPKALSMRSVYGGENKESEVIWNSAPSVISQTRTPELDLKEVHPLDGWMLLNVIDPYSAVLNLLDQINKTSDCKSSFEIYDGRRRTRLYFKTIGNTFLEQDRPGGFSGNAMVCSVHFDPIGGHRINSKWRDKPNEIDRFKIFIARPFLDQLLPIRVEVKSPIGNIIGRLDTRLM